MGSAARLKPLRLFSSLSRTARSYPPAITPAIAERKEVAKRTAPSRCSLSRKARSYSTAAGIPAVAALKEVAKRTHLLRGEGTNALIARALELEGQGHDIVHMEVGDPDFDTPAHITAAAIASLKAGQTHYEGAGGTLSLRESAAAFLRRTRPGIAAEAANILCMPGGKPIIFHTISALCEEGDEVIYPDPGFPAYETTIRWAGATPVPLRLEEHTGFRFSHEALRRLVSPRTKLIILCSPGNPTGGVLTREDLDCVAEAAKGCGAWVLSDEIYSMHVFDGQHDSVATRPGMAERTVVLDGCSKAFAMTGWRIGFGLFPPALVEPARNLAINSWTCLPPFVAAGAMAAWSNNDEAAKAMQREYRRRRDFLFERLNSIPGITVAVRPAGAMYLLANVAGTGLGAADFAERLLQETGVALLDAEHFGAGGRGFIRIAFAQSLERLAEGCDRIERFVASVHQKQTK